GKAGPIESTERDQAVRQFDILKPAAASCTPLASDLDTALSASSLSAPCLPAKQGRCRWRSQLMICGRRGASDTRGPAERRAQFLPEKPELPSRSGHGPACNFKVCFRVPAA